MTSPNISYSENDVHPSLATIFKHLDEVHNQLINFSGDSEALRRIQGRLNKIDNDRENAAFVVAHEAPPFYGQAVLHSMLQSCYTLLRSKEVFMEDASKGVNGDLQHIQNDLQGIISALERAKGDMSLLPRYQGMLDAIDCRRINGVFVPVGSTSAGSPKEGQGVLADLLNDAYGRIYSLYCHAEALEADKPVARELRHTQRHLHALLSEVENYHGDAVGLRKLQGRVNAVDVMRVDGKFLGQKDDKSPPPEGQGTLTDLLNQCFEKLRVKLELLEEMERSVHPSLQPLKHELDGILRDLRLFGDPHDLPTLRRIQGRLVAVDKHRVQGVFLPTGAAAPAGGGTPEALPGQGVLHDTLNEAYECLSHIQNKIPS